MDVNLRLEVWTAPTAGGIPVLQGTYAVFLPANTPVNVVGGTIVGALMASPFLAFGGQIVRQEGDDGWVAYEIDSTGVLGAERVGIRSVSTSAQPLPAAVPLMGFPAAPWPPFPAGGVAFDSRTWGQQLLYGLIWGINGTHFFADPPDLRGSSFPEPGSPRFYLAEEEVAAVPGASWWALIALAVGIVAAGALAVRRIGIATAH